LGFGREGTVRCILGVELASPASSGEQDLDLDFL
jgi:hypothetical protein